MLSGPLHVVVEYAPYGNMRQFLRSKRPTFSDQKEDHPLTLQDLVSYALQIAKGMEFLASKSVCPHLPFFLIKSRSNFISCRSDFNYIEIVSFHVEMIFLFYISFSA